MKLKSKVGMARGSVLHRQKQSSLVLRPNWDAVQWRRVFGINMTCRASRRRYQSGVIIILFFSPTSTKP